jgi:hypothetical protein
VEKVSAYRGIAGETVRLFARVMTLVSVIPALVFMAVTTLIGIFMAENLGLPPIFNLLVAFLAISPVLGSSGLGARGGDLESGISYLMTVPGEVFSFVTRFGALMLALGVPATLLGMLLIKQGVGPNIFAVGSFSASLMVFGSILLILFAVLLPVFSLIVCLASETVSETFTKERWSWLLNDRRKDLKAFFAAYFGGFAMFYLIVVPFIVVLIAVAFLIETRIGFYAAASGYLVPFGAAPVLLGRLAGTFVAADASGSQIASIEDTAALTRRIVEEEVKIKSAVHGIKVRAQEDLPGAIAEAEVLISEYPDNPVILADLCAMYIKVENDPKSLETGSKAIREAIRGGDRHSATITFMSLGNNRRQLRLGPDEFERLALTLITKKNFNDAVWCFQGCAAMGGKDIVVHKGIIATAEAARRAGDKKMALKIFEFFIEKYPRSQFVEYSKGEIQKIKA